MLLVKTILLLRFEELFREEGHHQYEKGFYIDSGETFPSVPYPSPIFSYSPFINSKWVSTEVIFFGSLTVLYMFFHSLQNLQLTAHMPITEYLYSLPHHFFVSEEFTIKEYSAPCSSGNVYTVKPNANIK